MIAGDIGEKPIRIKENDMKIYRVNTREAYDELMSKLEVKGYKWLSGHEPTNFDGFEEYGIDTYFYVECGEIYLSNGDHFRNHNHDNTSIEYKSTDDLA